MILARFFRPKWQHPNPQVRRQALVQLSPQDPDDQTILRRLAADDPEAEVRKAAIKRVSDFDFLRERAEQDQNAGVREVAAARYRQVLAGGAEVTDLADRLAELGACTDEIVLGHIARRAREPELRLAAMERLQAGSVLEEIAIHDAIPKVRQAAALRLTEAASLERVMRRAKEHDRRVARIAREALERLQQEQEVAERAYSERLLICESLERLAAAAQPDSAERQRLENRWSAVSTAPDLQIAQRFNNAVAQCRAREAEPPSAVSVDQPAVAPAPDLDAFVTALQQDAEPTADRVAQLRDMLTADADIDPGQGDSQALMLLRDYLLAATSYLEHEAKLGAELAALQSADASDGRAIARASQRLQTLVEAVSWRVALPAPRLLTRAKNALADGAQRQEQAAMQRERQRSELEDLLAALESSLSGGRLKESQRLLVRAQKLAEQLPAQTRGQLDRRLKHDAGRVRELQDWRRFATLPKQAELCEQMEALVDAALQPPELAERIHQLQEQWKATGGSGSPEGQQLWERFQLAGDRAFDRCRGYFDEQAQRRQENLQRRQEIAGQLEQFVTAADWPRLDLAGLETIRAQARAEWQAAVPVDRRAVKPIEAQFEALMETLTARIREKQQANRERKEALVAQAQQLVSVDDARAAAEEAKSLQAEWKLIGHAQPNSDRRLWREFRSACDEIFSRRDAARNEADQERHARLARAQSLCNEAEALVADEAAKIGDIETRLTVLREEFHGLRPLPREQAAALSRRLREVEGIVEQRRRREARAREQLVLAAARARAELCTELEQAALAGTTAAEEPWHSRWEALDEVPAHLQNRFEQRWKRALAAAWGNEAFTEDELAANLNTRWDLCLWMEILAGIDSPPEERARRMDLQVRRLADGIGGGGPQLPVREQAQTVEGDWLTTGPALPAAQTELLETRFEAARNKVAAAD